MYKVMLAICALVYCTSFGANSKSKIWDDGCDCFLPDKIQTVSPPMVPKSNEQIRSDFNKHRRAIESGAEKSKQDWLDKHLTPEEKQVWNKKGQKWDVVSSPSFCVGYAKTKIEQHPGKIYYKQMYEYFNNMISSTDMMSAPVDKEALLQGYDLNDDNKIMECVETFDKIRGFE